MLDAYALLSGIANDLVVHIGDVHHVAKLVSALVKKAAQDVDSNKGTEIADVAVVIDRGAASVHADLVIFKGMKLFDFAGERVVKTKRHAVSERAQANSSF